MKALRLLGARSVEACGGLALAAVLRVQRRSRRYWTDPQTWMWAARQRALTLLGVALLLLPLSGESVAAAPGIEPWFVCGIVFWGDCETPPPQAGTVPTEPPDHPSAPSALEDVHMWGTPLVGPTGAVSYQLPPRPVLDLFIAPSDDTARAYLQWMADKAQHREAAFAAIRRVAAEMGYGLGKDGLASMLAPMGSNEEGGSPVLALSGRTGHTDPRGTRSAARATDSAARAGTVPDPAPAAIGEQTQVFYFFSPQCASCAQQTPLLNALVRGRQDVVGIAMDTTEQELIEYVQQMRLTFPVLLDAGESSMFAVTAYPAVVALTAAGQVRRLNGLASHDELEELLKGV